MKKWLMHCKNAYKVMVLVKKSYQEDPFAVIFVVVVGRGEAYEIGFYKKSSKIDALNMSFEDEMGPRRSVFTFEMWK